MDGDAVVDVTNMDTVVVAGNRAMPVVNADVVVNIPNGDAIAAPADNISADAVVDHDVIVDIADVNAVVTAFDVAEEGIADGNGAVHVMNMDPVAVIASYVAAELVIDANIAADVACMDAVIGPGDCRINRVGFPKAIFDRHVSSDVVDKDAVTVMADDVTVVVVDVRFANVVDVGAVRRSLDGIWAGIRDVDGCAVGDLDTGTSNCPGYVRRS